MTNFFVTIAATFYIKKGNCKDKLFNRKQQLKFSQFYSYKTLLTLFLVFGLGFFSTNQVNAQNFELVTVNSVVTGSNTNNALFAVSSPTIASLAFIRAERLTGPADGRFTITGDNIMYRVSSATSGIPNNLSRIRFLFLQADGVTPIPVSDFRFVINDIDGPNNEALATDCGANVRFTATAIPTHLVVDNVPPDLNAVGTQRESNGPTSRVMYEFNDVSSIEFDNYANNGFLKVFDMNDNDFPIGTPLYAVCLGDSDGDGITDDLDLDDDNDGILDVVETNGNDPNGDHDGDGLPNYLDTVDNSGQHATYITNADGSTTDYTDADADGVPDIYEASADADSIPNHLDKDSDGDGCSDADEAYGILNTDTNGDGTYGGIVGAGQVDPQGRVIGASYIAPVDNAPTNGTEDYLEVFDTDNDGNSDFCDTDDDNDGNPDSTDPNPLVPTAVDDAFTAAFGSPTTFNILTNDDFLAGANTSITQTGGTAAGTVSFNATTGEISYTPTAAEAVAGGTVTVTYNVCNTTPDPDVCDTATVTITITDLIDTDGDGVTDGQETLDSTDPNDTCSYNVASQNLANVTATWNTADCDGDGVINGTEVTDGSDPNAPCDYVSVNQVVASVTGAWNALDCDGDGVINGTEITDSTDPLDMCSLVIASQTATPSSAWNAADCDQDGNPNSTDPNPLVPIAVDDAFTAAFGSPTTFNILTNDDFLAGANTSITQAGGTATGTVSFDPTTGEISYTPTAAEAVAGGTVTVIYTVCNTTPDPDVCDTATVTITITDLIDTDGDGVTGGQETLDSTDPNDTCSYNVASQNIANVTAVWNAADCDGDGVINGTEITDSYRSTRYV